MKSGKFKIGSQNIFGQLAKKVESKTINFTKKRKSRSPDRVEAGEKVKFSIANFLQGKMKGRDIDVDELKEIIPKDPMIEFVRPGTMFEHL